MEITSNLVSGKHYKEEIQKSLEFIADTLAETLGPHGKTTIVQDLELQHFISKDGYSVLRKIIIKENLPRVILDLLKRISFRLVRTVGDGSTTAVVASAELYRSLEDFGAEVPPKDILDGLNIISRCLTNEIKDRAISIDLDSKRLRDVAFISTNNDADVADFIVTAVREADYGPINVEKGSKSVTEKSWVSGMEVPRGFIMDTLATSQGEFGYKSDYDDAMVFMTDGVLAEADIVGLTPIFNHVLNECGRPLILVAKGYEGAVKEVLNANKAQRKDIPISAIDIATDTRRHRDVFEDLALYLGCEPWLKNSNEDLAVFDTDRLGTVEKFRSTEAITKFIGGGGDQEDIATHIEFLKAEIERVQAIEDHMERDDQIATLRKRAASLGKGLINIVVGGETAQEIEAKFYLMEDAVFACQSALKHGVVIGGSMMVPKILDHMPTRSKIIAEVVHGTVLTPEDADGLLDRVSAAFCHVYRRVLRAYELPRAQEAILANVTDIVTDMQPCYVAGQQTENPTDKVDVLTAVIDAVVGNPEVIFNAKTGQFEHLDETPVLNSAQTDMEVVKAAFSIIGLIVTSGQFLSTNLILNPSSKMFVEGTDV